MAVQGVQRWMSGLGLRLKPHLFVSSAFDNGPSGTFGINSRPGVNALPFPMQYLASRRRKFVALGNAAPFHPKQLPFGRGSDNQAPPSLARNLKVCEYI